MPSQLDYLSRDRPSILFISKALWCFNMSSLPVLYAAKDLIRIYWHRFLRHSLLYHVPRAILVYRLCKEYGMIWLSARDWLSRFIIVRACIRSLFPFLGWYDCVLLILTAGVQWCTCTGTGGLWVCVCSQLREVLYNHVVIFHNYAPVLCILMWICACL